MTERKKPAVTEIDPMIYFNTWAFDIGSSLYPALGVRSREVVDKVATAEARRLAVVKGMSESDAKKQVKNLMVRQIVIDALPNFQFQEGDIFYRRGSNNSEWLQIIKVISSDRPGLVEVHAPNGGRRDAYQVNQMELSEVLQAGKAIAHALRIPASQSSSESLRLMINQPELEGQAQVLGGLFPS